MRIVFMGTPDFAVPSLRALADVHEVVAVYTRPDAVSARGSSKRPSPVKEAARELSLSVREPRSLRENAELKHLEALEPDAIVVAAYGLILPPEVLSMPLYGAINVHASLLPRWRGAAPIEAAILAGDAVTGVSIMRMETGLDTGPYCAAVEVPVAGRSSDELASALADAGAKALLAALPSIEAGTCTWIAQDDAAASYAPRVDKGDVRLDPELTAEAALLRIRAASDRAPARIVAGGKRIRLLQARLDDRSVPAASVGSAPEGLLLGFSDGGLLVTRVKPEGRGEMDASAWLCGARLARHETWEAVT